MALKDKIKNLPKTSGVYIFRNKERRVIYVGKAINLKNRVSSYFQKNLDSIKTEQLVKNIADLEYLDTDSEIAALLLEAELVKRYKPKFNIDLKDDKNYLFLKIPKEDFPLPVFVRHLNGEAGQFLGPFTDAKTVRQVLKILRKIYPFRSKGDLTAKRACLYYHLGQCPGVCAGAISKNDYAKNIRRIVKYFEGKGGELEKDFEKQMKKAAKEHSYEEAARFRDKLFLFRKIKHLHISDQLDIGSKEDKALLEIKKYLNLEDVPRRIECFDISNIQGTNAVGSMVVFINGYPEKREYRKFKIRGVKGPNDPAMMAEVLRRRFLRSHLPGVGEKRSWDFPDLVVIDGGKGQLSVVRKELEKYKFEIPIIGLAKKFEEIYVSSKRVACSVSKVDNLRAASYESCAKFQKIILPKESEALYLLQRIRDEAHRFAITYFRSLHLEKSKKSVLDDIPGIGPKTKRNLIKEFGSVKGIKEASEEELVDLVGEKLAAIIKEML